MPAIFNALLALDGPGFHRHLHILSFLHSGSLLLAGILFSRPLAGPYLSHRLSPPESLLYLTSAWIGFTLLAYLVEFAAPGLYGGITAISRKDQQVMGLVLWIPACLLYLGGGIYLLREWMNGELWIHHDFYRQNKRRRIKTAQDQQPAPSGGFAGRGGGGVVIPQLGISDPLDHLA